MGICVKILQLCDAMLRGGLTSMFLAPGSILFLDNTLTLPRSPIAKRKKNLMKKPLYILTLKLLHHVFLHAYHIDCTSLDFSARWRVMDRRIGLLLLITFAGIPKEEHCHVLE